MLVFRRILSTNSTAKKISLNKFEITTRIRFFFISRGKEKYLPGVVYYNEGTNYFVLGRDYAADIGTAVRSVIKSINYTYGREGK